jgi:hypothetical protein
MKMSRVPTSLTAACIAAFGAKVMVKTGTGVPTTGEGADRVPSKITIADALGLRANAALAAFGAKGVHRDHRIGLAVTAMP